ncbi:hypothetical protein ACFXHA_43675 [Nocardia sp. NPDC059240]|uniref:hypothetical protein n=1 Tax=Nocardia sp. NPDC059240 TaxID=3346786 RepID=UPI0036908C30
MMVENYGRVRVPLEDRIPPGEQAGWCTFPTSREHLCPNAVIVKHVLGSKPKYCDQVVDGIRHTGKNAALARERFGLTTADVKRMAAEREAASPPSPAVRRERTLTPVPELPFTPPPESEPDSEELQLHEQLSASISAVQTASSPDFQPSPTIRENASEQPVLVSEAVSRVDRLVAQFEIAAKAITHSAETLAPQVVAALAAAGAAGAAEQEVIEVNASAAEKIARAETARRIAEESSAEHVEARRKMAIERDNAVAEMRKARQESDSAVARAKAEVEEARVKVQQVQAEANEAIDTVLHQAEETHREAEEKIAAAQAANTRAQGEAEGLRNQVKQLSEQLARRDTKEEARSEQHRREIKELHEYYQGIVKNTQEMLREAYALTGRQPIDQSE